MRTTPFLALAAVFVAVVAYLRWALSGAVAEDTGLFALSAAVLGICAGIVLCALVAIRADMKGRLRIVAGRVHVLGRSVEGHVALSNRGDLAPEYLEVALVLKRRVPERDGDGERTVEVWRHTEALPVPDMLSAGASRRFAFSLPIPSAERVQSRAHRFIRAQTDGAGPLLAMVGELMADRMSGRTIWTIETRMGLPGIDLTDRLRLTVNEA